MQEQGMSIGGIRALYLAQASEASDALAGGVLDISSFTAVEINSEDASFTEEASSDDHGTSYAVSISFSAVGEKKALLEFERDYINAELHALCINGSTMRLFTGLSFSRSAQSGARVADFQGRRYALSGVSAVEGAFVDSIL
jgi:hypothetical protein